MLNIWSCTGENGVETMSDSIQLTAVIARKDPRLPRFVIVPSSSIEAWRLSQTAVVEGTLNGHDVGRRSLKKWDEQRWFIELPQPLCERAKVDTGSRIQLALEIASDSLPAELEELLKTNPGAKQAWARLSEGSQRMLRENVAAAKQSATRARRAAAALGVKV
jgi:Bacteriocin-protection, YdeI or OmpD-Associated